MTADLLDSHDVALVRAPNPGPLTLTGTNSWLVGRDPCWLIDPGPEDPAHLAALIGAGEGRGGIGGIALTHDHSDHAQATETLLAEIGGGLPVAAVRHPAATIRVTDGAGVGPLRVHVLPGHAPDHVCYSFGAVCFTGDAVLGEGSVFLWPDTGALSGYLDGLQRLRAERFALLACGHGPVVTDVDEKLSGYIEHRLERERRLVEALESGLRLVDDLLDSAWSEVPDGLRPAAAVTLAAHLDKLDAERRLPAGVERPPVPTL